MFIAELKSLGSYVLVGSRGVVTLGETTFWSSPEQISQQAKRAGIAVSDHIIKTSRGA